MAKLTEATVRDIRRQRANGSLLADLAQQYGVGLTTVWFVVHNVTWQHVL